MHSCAILKGSFPLTLARMANQIVCVCCWLVNFQPVLISPPVVGESVDGDTNVYTEVDEYFHFFFILLTRILMGVDAIVMMKNFDT